MPIWDLATRNNWELVLNDKRVVTPLPNSQTDLGGFSYTPIPPIYAVCSTSTVLVGTYSASAKPYWFLGARISQFLYVSPSMSANFIGGVQAGASRSAGLNRLNLFKFDDYDIYPYALSIETPYWIEDIYIEVWQYEGADNTDSDDIILRLDSIEMKIDAMENYGT